MSPAEIKSRAPAVIGPRKSESDENGKEEQRWTSGLPSTKPTISPWLLEPSSKLLGFTSTKELPKHADIVVVGSGITGAFAAHFLKEGWAKDLSVVMLDAREACWGSSGQVSLLQPMGNLDACSSSMRYTIAKKKKKNRQEGQASC